jgi:O-antigen ligase/tetratricopeptide (TPR) repeat protein
MVAFPIAILAVLAACGAGLVPGSAPPLALALLVVACLRPWPGHSLFRAGLWSLAVLAAWTLVTTLPAGAAAGPWRAAQWADVQAFTARHAAACAATVAAPPAPRLSLHTGGTLRWLLLILGAGGMLCLVASFRTHQRLLLAKGLALLGGGVAASGLVGRFLLRSEGLLLGWFPVSQVGGGEPFGPFVNRNHFAAFCALLVPLCAVLTLDPPRHWRRAAECVSRAEAPQGGLRLSPAERLLFAACLLALLAGVLGSLSRGGTAAMLLGLVVVALLWLRRGPVAAALACLAGVAAMVLVALWPDAGFQGRLHELRSTASALGARWPVWLDALRLWAAVPFLGCGANAFGMVFPQVTTWATVQQATHAESECLQLLAEGGLVGALLAVVTIAVWCAPLIRGLAPRRRRPSAQVPYALLTGVAGALSAIGCQSWVDIPLRVPLCAWTAAAVAGLAAPLATRRRRGRASTSARPCVLLGTDSGPHHCRNEGAPDDGRTDAPLPHAPTSSSSSLLDRLVLAALLAGAVAVCWRTPGWRALYRDRDTWLAEATTPDIVALLAETPTYWQAWYELGQRLTMEADRAQGPRREALSAAGWDAFRAAVRSSPRDPRLRGALAARLWAAGLWPEARRHRDAQLALTPGNHGLRQHWLEAEWQAGQTDECSRLAYRFAGEAHGGETAPEYLLWLADRELAEGAVTRARAALLAVVSHRPAEPAVLKGLARCEARLGNSDQEAEWLRRLAATGSADASAWWRLAELARVRRDRTMLHEALGRAVQLDPSRGRAADEMWASYVQSQASAQAGGDVTPRP